MHADDHLAHADEALRALFVRFKEDPASAAFVELSEALLARGHAAEAAQVAEHGLQLRPNDSNGRVQRAAALLALGRARVAYVELLRALAIDATNRRGMRLLGRVYVDAGFPERAAKLLARRLERSAPTSSSSVDTRALTKEEAPPAGPQTDDLLDLPVRPSRSPLDRRPSLPIPAEPATTIDGGGGHEDFPELFASLTKDLGLAPLEPVKTKVEVTQVMRVRRAPDRSRALSSIEGPIVDTTNPGQLEYERNEALPPDYPFDVLSSPELAAPPLLDEDQAAPDQLALSVRGVSRESEEPDTLNDAPSPIDLEALSAAMNREAARLAEAGGEVKETLLSSARTELDQPIAVPRAAAGGPPIVEGRPDVPAAPEVPYLRRFERGRLPREVQAHAPGPTQTPAEDLKRAPLRVVEPPKSPARLGVALAIALVMLAFLAALAYLARDDLREWMADFAPMVSSGGGSSARPPAEPPPP